MQMYFHHQCIILLVTVTVLNTAVANQQLTKYSNDTKICKGWTLLQDGNHSSVACKCGASLHNAIQCDTKTLVLSILTCNAISYDKEREEYVAGNTFYACNFIDTPHTNNIAANATSLDYSKLFCGKWQREGLMCGKCKKGFGVPLYSYDLRCTECSKNKKGWLKYIARAYIPLTIFYITLAVFRISATSGELNTFILISQLMAAPSQLRQATNMAMIPKYKLALRAGSGFLGIWNLEGNYALLCVDPALSTMHVLALDYLIGIYPLILILITYLLVGLHDRFPLVVKICKPFQWCLSKFHRKWDIKNSIISYFATFILLSYVKILNVSFDLLLPTTLYNASGKAVKTVLYYDGEVEVFSSNHIPIAVLAIVMILIFNALPLLLLSRLHSQLLHTLMDVFQGCYSTSNNYNYRYFAAAFVLLRLINLALFLLTLNLFYCFLISLVLIIYAFALKPYKTNIFNYLDAILFLALGFVFLMIPMYIETVQLNVKDLKAPLWAGVVLCSYVIFHGVMLLAYVSCPRKLLQKISRCFNHKASTEPLPHRFEHEEWRVRFIASE